MQQIQHRLLAVCAAVNVREQPEKLYTALEAGNRHPREPFPGMIATGSASRQPTPVRTGERSYHADAGLEQTAARNKHCDKTRTDTKAPDSK